MLIPGQSMIPWRRKLAHMAPGLIPLIACLVPHDDPLPVWNLAVVIAGMAAMVVIAYRWPQGLPSDGENWLRTCLGYAVPPLVVLLLFPARAEYSGVVLCVLAFGDSAAAIGGGLWGTRSLPWNPDKSWSGLFSFIALAAPLASLAFWGEAHPGVAMSSAMRCGTTAAVLGAVAESLRVKLDDNIRISMAAFVGVVIAAQCDGGGASAPLVRTLLAG